MIEPETVVPTLWGLYGLAAIVFGLVFLGVVGMFWGPLLVGPILLSGIVASLYAYVSRRLLVRDSYPKIVALVGLGLGTIGYLDGILDHWIWGPLGSSLHPEILLVISLLGATSIFYDDLFVEKMYLGV